MNVKDILNFDIEDISKMNRSELAKTVSILSSASNKRIKRFNTKGISTPATTGANRSGGNFSVKGKSVNELRSEFVRVSRFLNAKTSTYKGYVNVQKEFEKRVGGNLSPTETKTFWNVYNKLSEIEPVSLKKYGSKQTQEMLFDMIEQKSSLNADELLEMGMGKLQESYEKIEEEYAKKIEGYNGTTDFFKFGYDL